MSAPKPRTVLSLESVLNETVTALDEVGVDGLSVRELARRLGAGVASIYWYVDGKNHLLDLAADRVLAQVTEPVSGGLTGTGETAGDPLDPVRNLGLRMFDALNEHRWCAGRVVQDPQRQPHSARALDLMGQQVAWLGLTVEEQFLTATTLMTYVIGSCERMARAQSKVSDAVSRDTYLSEAAQRWDKVDPAELPFLHAAADVLRQHDDREQFEFGLEMLLDGIEELTARRE